MNVRRVRAGRGSSTRPADADPRVPVELTVNGRICRADVSPGATLLQVLRGELRLTGTKQSCGRGECGACTVLVGGRPVLACVILAARVDDPVVTIEGVADSWAGLRRCFAEQGGFQCGFCTPGQIMAAGALLESGGDLNRSRIRAQMSGNICRCTGYQGIVEAVEQAGGARESLRS